MHPAAYPRAFGPYVLLERLGEGGMSEVDLARRAVDDADFVRFLVIKRIHPQHADDESFVRMFHDEARINAELQHENIASVYDFGQQGEEFFLAMEYVPGCDLRRIQRILARSGQRWPLPIALRVIHDVLAGLHYAHTRVDTFGNSMNIVHRDVNPRNVMLSMRGEVKLIDFGVAMADNRAEKTIGHSLKGKFAYMAPEQIEGGRPLDGRADVFAVGIVLYELLMGASPVAGLSEVQTMHRILAGQLPPVRSTPERPLPEGLLAVHARACTTRPEDRYADAEAMRRAIEEVAPRAGGLASRADLARFLREHDPELSTVTARLRTLRTELTAELPAPAPVGGASSPTSNSGTLATTPTRQTVHAPTVAAAAGAGAAVGGLVLVVGIAGLWLVLRGGGAGLGGGEPEAGTRAAEVAPDGRARAGGDGAGVEPAAGAATSGTAASGTAASGTAASGTAASGTAASGTAAGTGAPQSAPATPTSAPVLAAGDGADTVVEAAVAEDTVVEDTVVEDTVVEATGDGSDVAPGTTPHTAAPGSGEEATAGTSAAAPSAAAPSAAAPSAAGTSAAGTSAAGTSAAGTSAAAPPAAATAPAESPATASGGADTPAAGSAEPVGATGFLNISSRPSNLALQVDGRAVGRTPVRALELPVGRHTLVAVDPATGARWEQVVVVAEGRAQLVVLGESQ